MERVYLVTEQGTDFTDCGSSNIMGIFTNRDLAQSFVDSFENLPERKISIEVHSLNPNKAELKQNYKCYLIRMTRDGEVVEKTISDLPPFLSCVEKPYDATPVGFDCNGDLYYNTYARDIDHAVDICNKERLQLIAQNKWS